MSLVPAELQVTLPADIDEAGQDDTLLLLFMCCHPALTQSSAIALTLRAVGGLTTAEIASAFMVPEATMAQRISRAKQSIQTSGVPFEVPSAADRADRLGALLHVLYLIFSEATAAARAPSFRAAICRTRRFAWVAPFMCDCRTMARSPVCLR